MPSERGLRVFAFVLVSLAISLANPLAGEEGPADPNLEALVGRLGSEDFNVREKAAKDLIALGKETGRKLLAYRNHADVEIRQRIDHVLTVLGLMTPEKEELLNALTVRLFEVPAADRLGIINEISGLGPVAVDSLQARLFAQNAQLKAVGIPGAKWYTASDQQVTGWSVRLTNGGDKPLFIAPPRIDGGGGSIGRLVPRRSTVFSGRGFGFGRSAWREGGMRASPIQQARILAAGESTDIPVGKVLKLDRPGHWSLHFGVQASFEQRVGERGLCFGFIKKKDTDGTWEVTRGRAEATVYVYPDWAEARVEQGVALTVVTDAKEIQAGATLEAELRMENKSEKAVRIDKEWPRYCWVAFAHQKGSDLVPATAFELRTPKTPAGESPKEFQPRDLAPGESVTQKIAISVPATGGPYYLSAGYDLPSPQEGEQEGDVDEATGTGLVARAVSVEVIAGK